MSDTLSGVQLLVLLLVLTLAVALVAQRLRLPYTLALVVVGLALGVARVLPGVELAPDAVVLIFLPALLFEGAWNLDVVWLQAERLLVFVLAVPGVLLSAVVVAALLHLALGFSWLEALLVGAIVSPTDPVAVVSLLRQLGMSTRLRTIVEGESLFNDGVGAALYTVVLGLMVVGPGQTGADVQISGWRVTGATLWLIFGGVALGTLTGIAVTRVLRRIDDYRIEIAITVSVAYGVFVLADRIHTSGLLAVAFAGVILGSYGRRVGMSQRTRDAAGVVWEVVGYVANSLLFLLLGLHVVAVQLLQAIPGIVWAVIGVLAGRLLLIYLLVPLFNVAARRAGPIASQERRRLTGPLRPLPMSWCPLLWLSGIRGALSVALVLSLPASFPDRGALQNIVYGVVLVTLLGQGLGLRLLLPRWQGDRVAA